MNNFKKSLIVATASLMMATPQVASAQPVKEPVSITSETGTNAKGTSFAKENVSYQAQGEIKKIPGRNYSPDGKTPQLPYSTGNPYNVKPGDKLQLSNFRRSDFPICFVAFSCLFKPNYDLQVTSITDTKQGTRFTLSGFGGYDGHPVFKNGQLIGVVKGSSGGNAYGYLFPTAEEAVAQQVNYKPLRTGLFTRASHGSNEHPLSSRGGLSSRSSSRSTSYTGASSQEKGVSRKYVKEGVDPKESEYTKSNTQSWEKQGIKYLESVKWNASTKSFVINPKKQYTSSNPLLGLSSLSTLSSNNDGGLPINQMWKEAVSLGVPNIKSIEQQFRCHAQGSAIKKDNWSLEMGRPEAQDQAYYNRFACNPPRP